MKKNIFLLLICTLFATAVNAADTFSFSEDWESVTAGSGQNNLPSEWTVSTPGGWWMVVSDPYTGSNALKPDDSPDAGEVLNAFYTGLDLTLGLNYTVDANISWNSGDWPWTGFAMNIRPEDENGDMIALMFRIRGNREAHFNLTDLNSDDVSSSIVSATGTPWDLGETWHVSCSVAHYVVDPCGSSDLGMVLSASGYDLNNTSDTFEIPETWVSYYQTYTGWNVQDLAGGGGFAITSRANRNHYFDDIVVTGEYLENLITLNQSGDTTEVTEGGATDSFTVALAEAPNDTVTVNISYDSNQISLSDDSLVFTTGTWNSAQTVTVAGLKDYVIEYDHSSALALAATSNDSEFDGESRGLIVQITDGDALYHIGNYVDANLSNTVAADGAPDWYVSGAWDPNYEYTDGKWWYRTDKTYFLQGDVLQLDNVTQDFNGVEVTDQRLIITTIDGLATGTEYEVRAAFWGREPDSDSEWNIRAGLTQNDMEVYSYLKRYTTPQAEEIDIISALPYTGTTAEGGGAVEYQPLLGNAVADSNGEIDVYINGADLVNFGYTRTWYEGLLYQPVKLDIVETEGFTAVTDTTGDSFTIALDSDADGSDVVVKIYEITPADEVVLSTDTLTFSSGSYTTPQQVTVTGNVNSPDIKNTTLIIVAESADPAYDGFKTTLQVLDIDCGASGVPAFDLNKDCAVDFLDYAIYAQQWFDCTTPEGEGCLNVLPWQQAWW